MNQEENYPDHPVGPAVDPIQMPQHDPEGPTPETKHPWLHSPHDWYASQHGAWRKTSKYCSSMTPSEVPDDWTLQDRILAYLTLCAFARKQSRPSGSPES